MVIVIWSVVVNLYPSQSVSIGKTVNFSVVLALVSDNKALERDQRLEYETIPSSFFLSACIYPTTRTLGYTNNED